MPTNRKEALGLLKEPKFCPQSCLLDTDSTGVSKKQKAQEEPVAPRFLPKRFRQRHLLQEGNVKMVA